MPNVTRLLDAAGARDRPAVAEILPLVYDELRQLAVARLANEAGHALQPTLVHEAYLRLVGNSRRTGTGAGISSPPAEAMQRILINRARDRHR